MEYRVQRYFAGLDRTLTIVKSPTAAYVEDASPHGPGYHEDLATILQIDTDARRVKFGALPPEVFQRLSASTDSKPQPFAVYFNTPLLSDPRIQSMEEARRQEFYGDLRKDIAIRGEQLLQKLVAIGARGVVGEGLMPVIWIEASPTETLKIAKFNEVVLIAPNGTYSAAGQFANPNPSNEVSLPKINTEFNANGKFGASARVGFIESANCGAYDAHEAFTFTANGQGAGLGRPGITYEVEPIPCNSAADCSSCETNGYGVIGGVQCADIGRLPGKQCYNPHLTSTMSIVAASTPSIRWGASDVQFFIPNKGVGAQVAGSAQGIDHAYNWLVGNLVHITNESFSTSPDRYDEKQSSTDGIAQDYYSRIANIAIFRAAGNNQNKPNGIKYACPASLNSICVGAMTQSSRLSCYSNFLNLPPILGLTVGDREEPDVVAFGGGLSDPMNCNQFYDMQVANPQVGANDWTVASGTSAAAPQMASFAALLSAECNGGFIDALELRSWFRTMAFVSNPDGKWRYSTPQPYLSGLDFGDGGGATDAHAIRLFCNPGGQGDPRVGHFLFNIDPHRGMGSDLPPGGAPPLGTEAVSQSGIHIQDRAAPGAKQRVAMLAGTGHFRVGDRVRENISWNACTTNSIGTAPAQPAIDFDLFLYNRTTNSYVAASQSVDDTNEGYDHVISAGDGEGDYETYIAAIPGNPCGGFLTEPVAFGWAHWGGP